MNRVRELAVFTAVATLACAPAITIRPGTGTKPTFWSIRSDAEQVVLMGSMTRWRSHPFEYHDKVFELSLDLPPGRYEYRLEARDSTGNYLIFPEGVERTDDGFDGENLVLRVQ